MCAIGESSPLKGLRVGILTYHFSDNYGAMLQAYTLRSWFHERGCSAEFVNYQPNYLEAGGRFSTSLDLRSARENLKVVYLRGVHLWQKIFGNATQHAALNDFRRRHLGARGTIYKSRESVFPSLSGFNLLVTGSDQVWSPSGNTGLDPVYFLDFPPLVGQRRISYAASFGRGELPQRYEAEVAQMLAGLDGISVRERSGVAIVERFTKLPVTQVPDPTILRGHVDDLVIGDFEQEAVPYVFCHVLRSPELIRDVTQRVADELGARIWSGFNPHRRWREIGDTYFAGPREWVSKIAGASFVVTNSYHAAITAILRRRPFFVVALSGARHSLNDRILDLLRELGLQDRAVTSFHVEDIGRKMGDTIDWDDVERRLAVLRTRGERYLDAELEKL